MAQQKLYTEEQVREAMSKTMYALDAKRIMKYIDEHVTPIELPSDEEIEKQSFQVPYDGTNEFYDKSFINGAKWMKNKIINQNK